MKLDIRYFHNTDTLFLWNGRPASEGGDLIATGTRIPSRIPRNGEDNAVTESIIAGDDADGKVVGFTTEHAADLMHSLMKKWGRILPT